MKRASLLLFSFLVLTICPSLSNGKEVPKIAVWDLDPVNTPPAHAKQLTSFVVSEITKLKKYEVYSQENVRTLSGWTAERMQVGCTDTRCLLALGQMDIAKLISGSVGKIGKRYTVSLNLFDTEKARAENAISKTCESEDELIELIQASVRELLVESPAIQEQNRSNLRDLEESRRKIQEIPPMPRSVYIKEGKILFQGFEHGVAAWATFSSRKDGKIRWPIPFQGEMNIAQFYLLVQNFENTPINLTPSKIRLIMKENLVKDALLGFRVLENLTLFGPEILEFNGEEVFRKKLSSINLRKDDYAVIGASFEMHPDDDNAVSAIGKTEGLNLPLVFMGKSENILYIRRTSKTK